MDCADFDRRLDGLLDGTCPPEEWRRAEGHLAGCARCRRLLDALGGRAEAGTLDPAGEASLTASILAATSGSPCIAARERLCDFVDRALPAFDRGLVEAHLAGCRSCAALAGALSRATAVLPSFAELAPPAFLAPRVLAATSRRAGERRLSERVAAWLGHAALRPRFSIAVAYAATALIFVFVGDPVDAFRRVVEQGSVYAQPAIAAVGEQVAANVATARGLGAEAASAAASLTPRRDSASTEWDAGVGAVRRWLASNLGAPLASLIERMSEWIQATMDTLIRLVRPEPRGSTAPAGAVPETRDKPSAEPFQAAARLS
jgi:predicted anti-sigma-YlaC factor YlaD